MTIDLRMDFPANYRILVHGIVDETWHEFYDNMVVEVDTTGAMKRPLTILTGPVIDQAALLGLLTLLYNMQCPLLSVECLIEK